MRSQRWLALAGAGALALGLSACGGGGGSASGQNAGGQGGGGGELSGNITVDGSSTVQPFAEAAAELFAEENPNVRITVGGAGTGDGFEKFCKGETDVSNASREIEAEERDACKKEGVETAGVQVANDGIAVVTNKALNISCAKTDELKEMLEPDSKVQRLSEVNRSFPDQEAKFFTPGEESGTFEFFTEEVLGTDKEQRQENVQTSADDNVLVQGVSGDPGGIGYFGFSFFEQNQDKLNPVAVDGGDGCVRPSLDSIQSGQYKPLSRPLFMYPNAEKLKRPELKGFMDFVVANQQRIAEAAKIVPMTQEQATTAREDLRKAES